MWRINRRVVQMQLPSSGRIFLSTAGTSARVGLHIGANSKWIWNEFEMNLKWIWKELIQSSIGMEIFVRKEIKASKLNKSEDLADYGRRYWERLQLIIP